MPIVPRSKGSCAAAYHGEKRDHEDMVHCLFFVTSVLSRSFGLLASVTKACFVVRHPREARRTVLMGGENKVGIH